MRTIYKNKLLEYDPEKKLGEARGLPPEGLCHVCLMSQVCSGSAVRLVRTYEVSVSTSDSCWGSEVTCRSCAESVLEFSLRM